LIIYLSDREIGIQWDRRGVIHTLDREGNKGERFTRPPGSQILFSDGYVLNLYTAEIEKVIEALA
jgi:hypothetical protein